MAPTWDETENLTLDRDGVLWSRYHRFGRTCFHHHGKVEEAQVPPELEPELEQLRHAWQGAIKDERGEHDWFFRIARR